MLSLSRTRRNLFAIVWILPFVLPYPISAHKWNGLQNLFLLFHWIVVSSLLWHRFNIPLILSCRVDSGTWNIIADLYTDNLSEMTALWKLSTLLLSYCYLFAWFYNKYFEHYYNKLNLNGKFYLVFLFLFWIINLLRVLHTLFRSSDLRLRI